MGSWEIPFTGAGRIFEKGGSDWVGKVAKNTRPDELVNSCPTSNSDWWEKVQKPEPVQPHIGDEVNISGDPTPVVTAAHNKGPWWQNPPTDQTSANSAWWTKLENGPANKAGSSTQATAGGGHRHQPSSSQ